MKRKTKIKKLLIVSVIFTLITWFVAVSLFLFIENENNKNSALFDEITEQTSRRDEIVALSRNTKALEEGMSKLDELFVGNNQEAVVSLIEEVESIAKTSGPELVISQVNISPIGNENLDKYFENVDLEIEVEGSWKEVYYFLNLLENLPHNIKFKQSKISSTDDNSGNLGWKAYFNVSVARTK